MIGPNRRRGPGQRGAVLVETALGVPIVVMMLFALVDLGMWTMNSNQATNAAHDGARTGILNYETADVVGSDDWNEVVAAAERRLDRDLSAANVSVSCVTPAGAAVLGGCADAVPRVDRVQVDVDWEWGLVTPIAFVVGVDQGEANGSSVMEIVGLPSGAPAFTTTTLPLPCTVAPWALSQSPVKVKVTGRLDLDLTITWTTGLYCFGPVSAVLQSPSGGQATVSCGCGTSPNFSWTIGKNAHSFWTPGVGTLQIIVDGSIALTAPVVFTT